MSHEQFLAEPAEVVSWMIAMSNIEGQAQKNLADKARREARR